MVFPSFLPSLFVAFISGHQATQSAGLSCRRRWVVHPTDYRQDCRAVQQYSRMYWVVPEVQSSGWYSPPCRCVAKANSLYPMDVRRRQIRRQRCKALPPRAMRYIVWSSPGSRLTVSRPDPDSAAACVRQASTPPDTPRLRRSHARKLRLEASGEALACCAR